MVLGMSSSMTLLALLGAEPSHGYNLKQRYDEHFARKRPMAFGQVYATLTRFEKSGWVELTDVHPGDGPDRRLFRITPEGVTTVDSWLFTAQDPELFSSSSLFSRVTVALLSGRDADEVLTTQRAAHMERMRDLQTQRRTATGADLLAVTYELVHLDADLRWIAESGARLATTRAELTGTAGDR
jgi:DNA-binding PadR family transcriptional regulator